MNPNNLYLVSDFTDYMDHWFAPRTPTDRILQGAPTFYRCTDDGMSRLAALKYMSKIGLQTPQYTNRSYGVFLKDFGAAVFHTDLYAHRGEGKVLVKYGQDWPLNPRPDLAVQYIPNGPNRPTSYRIVMIGSQRYGLCYQSNDTWRSNAGSEWDIRMWLRPWTDDRRPLLNIPLPTEQRYPLIAIDLVYCHQTDRYLAIDFNTAPGLKGTPVEDKLPAKQAAHLIANWIGERQGATAKVPT